MLAAWIAACSSGSDGPDALGPEPPEATAPVVSDPVSFARGASFNVTGTGFVYVSLAPATVPGAISATVSNSRTGNTLTLALVEGGLDPVAIPGSVGDTVAFAIQPGGGGSPTSFALVVPSGLRPSVVRTHPPGRRDQPMLQIVRVVFSEPMNPVTITGGTVQILLNGNPLSGQVAASADGLSATLELDQPLAPLTEYTLVLGAGLADLDGEALGAPVSITFTTGTSPAGPLLSEALAFTAFGDQDIHVMNADGTGIRRLTSEGAPFTLDGDAAWSPDGNRVAFTRYPGDPTGAIHVMNADGTNLVRLSPAGADDRDPTWSPDGGRIAFENRLGSEAEIYVMNADGTNRVRLTNYRQPDFSPAWSPDGTRIAYVTYTETGNADIHVINADGTNRVNLTNDDVFDLYPAWSPDGSRIVFERSIAGFGNDLFVINADGTNLVRLTTLGSAAQPAWSPDARLIAFTRYAVCGDWDYGCPLPDIWVVRATDGQLSRLAPGQFPAWRP